MISASVFFITLPYMEKEKLKQLKNFKYNILSEGLSQISQLSLRYHVPGYMQLVGRNLNSKEVLLILFSLFFL